MKWEGYDDKDNTWEPPENFDSLILIKAYEDGVQEKGKSKKANEQPVSKLNREYCPKKTKIGGETISKKRGPSSAVNCSQRMKRREK